MNQLKNLIERAVDRYGTYIELNDIDEDLKNEIILAAADDRRVDKSDLLLDGNFDLIELMRDVNNAKITTDDMYNKILRSLKKSVEELTNELLTEEMDERINEEDELDDINGFMSSEFLYREKN